MGKQKKALVKPPSGFALAEKWPVYEALLSDGWDKQGALVTILIARRSPMSGKVAAGSFLVDLGCLGVKSAQVRLFKDLAEYRVGLRAHVANIQPMAPADFDLAAKIIITGREYAAGLGFKPDPVYAQAEHLLAGADPEASSTPVPTGGPDGRPNYISGPNDDPERVVSQLTRAVGEGNFHFTLGGGWGGLDLLEDEL